MKLSEITDQDERAHQELHLKFALKDNEGDATLSAQIDRLLNSRDGLPDLEHPADIHGWLEEPERKVELESRVLRDG